jgi:hypothetical protein
VEEEGAASSDDKEVVCQARANANHYPPTPNRRPLRPKPICRGRKTIGRLQWE